MTNEEFLDFDTSIFYEPGYEEELKFMGALTAATIFATQSSSANYDFAKKHGKKTAQPNVWARWFGGGLSLRKFYSSNLIGTINPKHEKANKFIQRYEEVCKTFLSAYDKQYARIGADTETKAQYYTAHLCDKAALDLVCKKGSNKLEFEEIARTGFIDLRLPICYSLNENKQFYPNEYSEEMADAYRSFDNTLADLVIKFGDASNTQSKSLNK